MNLGQVIKRKREENGLTQKQLATLVGCAEITIRQYENGSREPRKEKLELIAEKLGTTFKALMLSTSIETSEKLNIIPSNMDELRKEVGDLRYSLNEKGLVKTRDYMRDLMEISEYRKDIE